MVPLRSLARLIARPVALATALLPALALAQTPAPLTGSIAAHPGWPTAAPADVSSATSILDALYSSLSGPAGQPRDWQRFRSLFLPDAQLIPIRALPVSRNDAVILSPDAYVDRASRTMATQGFFERGIHAETEQFGAMFHVWSTYESRHSLADPAPFARGINSVQLLRDGSRFWIVNLLWTAETPTTPLPTAAASISTNAPSAPPATPTKPDQLNSPFAGHWVGTLAHTGQGPAALLPIWLTMAPAGDGTTVQFTYLYDAGPHALVRERTTLAFAPAYTMATVVTEGAPASAAFRVGGLETLHTSAAHLTLTGIGTEAGKPADIRITLTLSPTLFTWRKEVRPRASTAPFALRDTYTLTRELPPTS